MDILVAGGCGYIGSHVVLELIKKKFNPIIIDFSKNSKLVQSQIHRISGLNPILYNYKISSLTLNKITLNHDIKAVIHLAGFKSVNESIIDPIKYYENNLNTTISLLKLIEKQQIENLIFSSSATVYGVSKKQPVIETSKLRYSNPYGHTKIIIEKIIDDYCRANKNLKAISLRYFNPIGIDNSQKLKFNLTKQSQNLIPKLLLNIKNKQKTKIFGNNYQTKDGTCIRDYIHVSDLAEAHIVALSRIRDIIGHKKINIGTGKGVSVLQLIKTFEKVNKIKIDYEYFRRRKGDAPVCYANTNLARKFLKWKPRRSIKEMCIDSYNNLY